METNAAERRQEMLTQAWQVHHSRNWVKAVQLWDALAAAFPETSEAAWAGGWALREAGRRTEADERLLAATQNFPYDSNAFVQYAWAAHAAADWPAAVARWALAREHHPRQATGWWAGAQALREAGQVAEAEALMEAAVASFPRDIWCWYERLNIALAQENAATAFGAWQQLRSIVDAGGLHHLRMMTVRVFRLETSPERLHELLSFMLDEDPFSGEGVPFLWQFIKELLDKEVLRAPGHEVAGVLRRSMTEFHGAVPFVAFCLALLRMDVPAAAIMADVEAILVSAKPWLLGTLLQLNESLRVPVIGALTFRHAIAPRELPPLAVLELLRMALVYCPAGFDTLVRRLRPIAPPEPHNEQTPVGLTAAVIGRFRLPEDMPVPSSVTRLDRPLRIALCISGQLRGFRRAHASWGALGLADHHVVTVVHAWKNLGRRQLDAPDFMAGRMFPPPLQAAYTIAWNALGGLGGIQRRFPALVALFHDAADVQEAELREEYQTDSVVIEDDRAAPFEAYSNQEKMFYKIHAAHHFALGLGQSFDLCIRLRPDKEAFNVAPVDWQLIRYESERQRLIYSDSGSHYVMSGPGAGDQFATGTPDIMTEFAAIWPASQHGATPPSYGAPDRLAGHSSLAHHLFRRGLRVLPVGGIGWGTFFDAAPIEPSRIEAALRQDIGASPRDAVDSHFLDACAKVNGIHAA